MLKLTKFLSVLLLLTAVLSSLRATQANNPLKNEAAQNPVGATPRKRALLIGISDYSRPDGKPADYAPRGKYWWNLNSGPDVELLRSSLESQFGFQTQDIKVLTTKQETTHKNIVDTFKSFLIAQTNPGDIVYFHYSGHGTQVLDDKEHGTNPIVGDEIDGLDETLVPSDYIKQTDGSNNIRDDEIGELLGNLKRRNPDSITVTMDSCFSGSNTRSGEHLMRGTSWEGSVPNIDRSHAQEDSASGLLTRGAAVQQGLVVISATSDKQLAGETTCKGQEMGLFTCALVTAFSEATDNTTYRDVFEKVNDYVLSKGRSQSPQLEGGGNQRVMKLGAAPPQPYVLVQTLGSRIILQAGRLQGMSEGSRFDIHPKGADPKDTKPIAQAEITGTPGLTNSVLTITSAAPVPKPADLHLSRAVETLHNFGDQRLRVNAVELSSGQHGPAALKAISELKLVNTSFKPNETAQVRICRGACKDELKNQANTEAPANLANVFTLMREDGSILRRLADTNALSSEMEKALEGEARWRYVKEVLQNTDRYINLKFRLVPVTMVDKSICDPEKDPNCNPTKPLEIPTSTEGGQMVVYEGDLFQLEFLNTGILPVYVTVLDLRSDGTIGPLWPHPSIPLGNAEENLIKVSAGGEWQRIPWQFTVQITPPFGPEMFKAIATRAPADFSALVDPPTARRGVRGEIHGGRGAAEAKTDIGQLLLSASAPKLTRGDLPFLNVGSVAVSPMNWATTEITFEARPKR